MPSISIEIAAGPGNCRGCPVEALACLGTIHPGMCAIRGEPGRADQLRAIALLMAGRAPYPDASGSPDDGAAIDAELCTWADPDGPCGCGGPDAPARICRRPGRPAEVRRPYCLQCVALPGWDGRPG